MILVAAAAIFFASIAFIGVWLSGVVCADIVPADDGPAPGKPPSVALIAASGVLGGILVASGAQPLQLGIGAIVLFALVACWCSDATCGIVPDVFTLPPLALLLFFAIAHQDWGVIASAAITFVPFAGAALFTRGYGMGWGDAKLVALTGAVLGAPLGAFALAVACAVAVIVHRFGKVRHAPIAFAPYIAAFTGVALPLGLVAR